MRFFETEDGDLNGKIVWESLGKFSPSDVHHQFGIVLRSPPYKDKFIGEFSLINLVFFVVKIKFMSFEKENNVKVFVQLYRSTDEETSEAQQFIYKPNSHNRIKRKRFDSMIPTVVEPYESSSASRDFSSSSNAAHSYGNQNLNFGSSNNNSGGTSNQQQEETETDTDLNVLMRFVTTELCGDKNAESDLLKYFLEGECDLVMDAAAPSQMSQPSDLNVSVLEKLKFIVKLFRDNLSEEKIHDMMMAVIHAAEEHEENILIDVIQYGTMNDIKELVTILVKYKLFHILQSKNEIDQNALHLSVILGYANLIKVLIKLGINANEVDAFGQTSMHVAVQENSVVLVQELLCNYKTMLLNDCDDNGHTPLSLSVLNNNLEIAKLLINAGADTKKQNPTNGFTCLHTAINNNNESINMNLINHLIDTDSALLTINANNGMNVLQMAIANKLAQELIDHLKLFYDEKDIKEYEGEEEQTSEGESSGDENDGEILDEKCLNELCKIFDKNSAWQIWSHRMDLDVQKWAYSSSPSSRALFEYLIVSTILCYFIQNLTFKLIPQENQHNIT